MRIAETLLNVAFSGLIALVFNALSLASFIVILTEKSQTSCEKSIQVWLYLFALFDVIITPAIWFLFFYKRADNQREEQYKKWLYRLIVTWAFLKLAWCIYGIALMAEASSSCVHSPMGIMVICDLTLEFVLFASYLVCVLCV